MELDEKLTLNLYFINSRKLILFILIIKLRKLRFRAVNLSRATKLVSSVSRSEPEDLSLSVHVLSLSQHYTIAPV